MTDAEIEEKLRSLSPTQLSNLLGRLSGNNALSNNRRQELLELQGNIEKEIKERDVIAKSSLREKGPQILELIHKSLREDNLTIEERKQLEKTASMLAGYQMSFWLPLTLIGKLLMFLCLIVGIIGFFQWSPWLGLFIPFACSFSPRIVGEALFFIGKLNKNALFGVLILAAGMLV